MIRSIPASLLWTQPHQSYAKLKGWGFTTKDGVYRIVGSTHSLKRDAKLGNRTARLIFMLEGRKENSYIETDPEEWEFLDVLMGMLTKLKGTT